MMRSKQDPVEFVLEKNPELDWDDLLDVRTVAELLGAMITDLEEKVYDKTWYRLPDNKTALVDNCFYLIAHPDFDIPIRAKYHELSNDDGYFGFPKISECINTYLGTRTININNCKYFMPLPELPDDYKE